MTGEQYRLNLLKVFWKIVNEVTGKDMAYEYAESLYPGKVRSFPAGGMSKLTIDELKVVVSGLIEKTGASYITVPVWHKSKKNKVYKMDGWATDAQLDKIKIMAAEIGLSKDALRALAAKMNKGQEVRGKCPVTVAQKVLNALKAMKARHWKPTGKPAKPAKRMEQAKEKRRVPVPPAAHSVNVVKVDLNDLRYQSYWNGKSGRA